MAASEQHTPVLVVGGSLVGLSSALFLAWHGVRCLVVERHADLLVHPRLRVIYPRAMEAYRQVGLDEAIYAAARGTGAGGWQAVRAETLAGEHDPVSDDEAGGSADASPCAMPNIDQHKVETLLRARAEELGARVRFATELTSFQQEDNGVTATLTDRRTGAAHVVTADYLIAAEGGESPIRHQLGIATDGPGPLSHQATALISADLAPALRGRRVDIAYLRRPNPRTVLLAQDDAGRRWAIGTGYSPADGQSLADFTAQRWAEVVRAAAGLPHVDVELRPQIPGTDLTVLAFTIGAHVARQYRLGRVFLAGDAAHVVPPTGGLGGGTGILDAHNLAWKVAMVVRGIAGPGLLHTYHAERYPVGVLTMRQALARGRARMGLGDGTPAEPILSQDTVTLGYQYRSSAVLGAAPDTAPLPPTELGGQPGTRAPHLALPERRSTIDWYGRRFVLLSASEGAAWTGAAQHLARRLGVPLDAHRLAAGAAATHGLKTDGVLLVRPDGFVAWRSAEGPVEPVAELEQVLRTVLSR
jgi:putative polyketide hydroxylase